MYPPVNQLSDISYFPEAFYTIEHTHATNAKGQVVHDLLVVLTNYNVQKEYPAGTTLEDVRQDLEREYPAYSKENTSRHFEEQRDKGRVLCIPGMRSNKAG